MACTIDHLRVDHRVTVLRDFTDLAGLPVHAGEAGVLRGIGLDYAKMEIWIELERNGRCDKLRFALRATDGPRNGRMKEFFEMGESIEVPSLPMPKPAALPPEGPKRPPLSLHAYVGKQTPNDTSLGEIQVACDCDPNFHRQLLPNRGGYSLYGCLHCGTVTCSRSFGDDGRFTGNAWQETRTVLLSDSVHRWVAHWPRVKVDYTAHLRWPMSADFVRYPTLYYPADTRCTDADQLAAIESQLARQQSTQSVAARLRATHRVDSSPPVGIPAELAGYEMLWEALQLTSRSDLADLIHLAQPRSLGCEIAADLLRQRSDAFELVLSSLRSPDETRRGVGFVIARDLRPPDRRLSGILIEMMNGLPFDPLPHDPQGIVSRGRFEMILLLIAELKLATPEMLSTLRTLMRKFARHDPFLVNCVRIVVRELDAAAKLNAATQ